MLKIPDALTPLWYWIAGMLFIINAFLGLSDGLRNGVIWFLVGAVFIVIGFHESQKGE